jgi:hypothetical protein
MNNYIRKERILVYGKAGIVNHKAQIGLHKGNFDSPDNLGNPCFCCKKVL